VESGIIYNSTKIDRLLLSWCICFTTFSEVVAQCCWSGSGMLIQATFTTTIPLLPVARHNAVSRSLWKYIVRQFNMPSRDRHFLTSFRFTVCSSSLCCLHKNRSFYFKHLHLWYWQVRPCTWQVVFGCSRPCKSRQLILPIREWYAANGVQHQLPKLSTPIGVGISLYQYVKELLQRYWKFLVLTTTFVKKSSVSDVCRVEPCWRYPPIRIGSPMMPTFR